MIHARQRHSITLRAVSGTGPESDVGGRYHGAAHGAGWSYPAVVMDGVAACAGPTAPQLHHSDRRAQYTSARFQSALRLYGASAASVAAAIATTTSSQIAAVEPEIRDHLSQHPGPRTQRDLLTSIPGTGEKTAAVLLAELLDKRYTSARQAAAFAGLGPRIVESGT